MKNFVKIMYLLDRFEKEYPAERQLFFLLKKIVNKDSDFKMTSILGAKKFKSNEIITTARELIVLHTKGEISKSNLSHLNNKENQYVCYLLGFIYEYIQNKHYESITQYEAALTIEPGLSSVKRCLVESLVNFGCEQYRSGGKKEAIVNFKQAIFVLFKVKNPNISHFDDVTLLKYTAENTETIFEDLLLFKSVVYYCIDYFNSGYHAQKLRNVLTAIAIGHGKMAASFKTKNWRLALYFFKIAKLLNSEDNSYETEFNRAKNEIKTYHESAFYEIEQNPVSICVNQLHIALAIIRYLEHEKERARKNPEQYDKKMLNELYDDFFDSGMGICAGLTAMIAALTTKSSLKVYKRKVTAITEWLKCPDSEKEVALRETVSGEGRSLETIFYEIICMIYVFLPHKTSQLLTKITNTPGNNVINTLELVEMVTKNEVYKVNPESIRQSLTCPRTNQKGDNSIYFNVVRSNNPTGDSHAFASFFYKKKLHAYDAQHNCDPFRNNLYKNTDIVCVSAQMQKIKESTSKEEEEDDYVEITPDFDVNAYFGSI